MSLLSGGAVIAFTATAPAAAADVIDNGYSHTFYVNDARDVADATPGDGSCATRFTAGDPAVATCTLYAAIQEANARPSGESILIAPAPLIRQLDGSFASSALIELNWNATNNPAPQVGNMSGSMTADAGVAAVIDGDTASRYWIKHNDTTLDFQNRIGWTIAADVGPNVLLFTGKNQTIRNFSQLTSAESSIYVGSTAENFSVLNGAIQNPATTPPLPSNYAVERSIVIVEGAKNTTVQNVHFQRAYWDAVLLAPAQNTSLRIDGLLIDRSTWDQPTNGGAYDPLYNYFLRPINNAVSGNDIRMTNNTIQNWGNDVARGAVVSIEGAGLWTNIVIRGNTFTGTTDTAGNPIIFNGVGATTATVRDNVFAWKGTGKLASTFDRAWVRTLGNTSGVRVFDNQFSGGDNSPQISLESSAATLNPAYRNTMTGVGGTPTAANENGAFVANNLYNVSNSGLRTTIPNSAKVIDDPPQTCRIDVEVAAPSTSGGTAIPTQDIYVDAYIGGGADVGGDGKGLEQHLGRVRTTQAELPRTFEFNYTGAGEGHVVRLQTTEIATGKTSAYSRTIAATGADTCAPNSWVKQGGWLNEIGTVSATQEDPTSFRKVGFDVRTSEPLGANGLDAEDFVFSGTAVGQQVVSLTQTSPTTWRLTAKANGTGTIIPSISLGSISDVANNPNIEASNAKPGPINFSGYLDADQISPVPGAEIDSTVLYNSPLEIVAPTEVAVSEPGTDTTTFRVQNTTTNAQGLVTKAPMDTIFLNQLWSDLVPDATLPIPIPAQSADGIVKTLPTHLNLSSTQPTMDTIDRQVDVPVRAIDNAIQDGTRTATLNVQVVSTDFEFDGLLLRPVAATISDDDLPDAAASIMTTVTDGALADGTSINEVKAVVKKADGTAISNATVTVHVPAGVTYHPVEGAAIDGPTSVDLVTPANGEVKVSLTSIVGGTDFVVNAQVNGDEIITDSPQTITFTSLPVVAAASSYNVSTGEKAADGAQTHDITVLLVNELGAPATGSEADLSAATTPATGVTVGAFTETATPGTYVATIASTVAGSKTVTVAIGAEAISTIVPEGQSIAHFVAGVPEIGPEHSSLTVSTGTRTANGVDAHSATIVLVDAHGNSITGAAAALSATTTSDGVTIGSFVEGAAGVYTATIVSTGAGSIDIEASHSLSLPVAAIGSGSVEFVAGAVDEGSSILTVTPDEMVAGVESHTASVLVVDANGNPVSGVTVAFASAPIATPTALGTAVSGANGVASFDFTSESAGTYSISAKIDGTTVGDSPLDVVFKAGPVYFDSATPSLSATAGEVDADGSAFHSVTVHVEDQFGNPVGGAAVIFTLAPELELHSSSGGLATPTNANGEAQIRVTSTSSGTWEVSATVSDVDVPATAGSPASVSFSASAPDAARSALTVTTGDVVANGTATHTATVVLRDVNDNPVSVSPNAFVITVPGAVVGTITETTTLGTYEATIKSTNAGAKTVTATIGATIIPTPQPVSFVADAPDFGPGRTEISATTGSKPADGTMTHTATVTVRDANGNRVPNQTVVFGVETLIPTSATTVTSGADGTAWVTVASTGSGEFNITATVDGMNVTEGSPAMVTFEAGAPSGGASQLAVAGGPKVADGTDSYSATVTVRDANGNPVGAGHTVSFATTGGAIVSSPTANTNASGVATITVTSREAGSFALSATMGGIAVQDSPTDLVFVAGAPDFGPDGTAIAATTGPKVADGTQAHTATVTVFDAEGNPVQGAEVVFVVPAPATASSPTTTVSNAAGVATVTVTSEAAGQFGITATVGGTDVVTGSPALVLFTAGAVDLGKTKLSITTNGNTVVADGVESHEAQVIVLDGNDNPVSGIVVNFGADAGATLSNAAVTTDVDGSAVTQIQATVAGSHQVSAEISGTQVTDSPAEAVFANGPASAAHSAMALSTGAVEADGTATHTAAVTVRDQFGNTVEGVAIDFVVGAGATPSATTATSNANGIAEISITSVNAGNHAVASQLEGTEIDSGEVTFASGAASAANSTWTVTPDGPIVANSAVFYTATVTVHDSNANPVAGADVNFGTLPAGLTMAEAAPHTSDANGKVVVRLSAVAAGSYDLSVYLGGDQIGATQSLAFIAGEVSAETSTIGASVSTVEANGTASSTVTVRLLDANGNIVSDFSGEVVILTSLGTVGSTVSLGNGVYEAVLTSVVSGDATASFTLDGAPATNTVAVTFVATPTAPIINPSNGNTVTGVADPGTTIEVKDSGGNVLCSATADPTSGEFSCGPLVPTPGDGDTVLVSSTNEQGFSSADVPVAIDSTVPVAPEVDPTDGSSVAGTVEPGTTVTVTDPSTGDVLCEVVADASGAFTCNIDPKLADGAELEVTSKDPAGNVSPPTSVIVDGAAPSVPVVDPTGGSSVSGAAEPGSKVTVKDAATGDVVCEVVADASGAFTCTIDPKLADGIELEVTSKDPAGNVSPPGTVIVDGVAPAAPEVNDSNGAFISGSAEPGSTITVKDPVTGDVVCEVVADGTGQFACAFDPRLEDGKGFEVSSKDPAGNVSPPTTVVIDGAIPSSPQVNPTGGSSVTGTAEPGAIIKVKDLATGDVLCEVEADVSGAFDCVMDPKLADGTEIEVTATDSTGDTSPPTTVIVDGVAPVSPVVDPTDGGSVTGTTEPGTTITVTDPSTGDVLCEVIADGSGVFACTIVPKLEDGKEIAVTSKDPAGNVSPPTSVIVDGSVPVAPVVDPTDGGSVTGTTEPGTTITVTDPSTGDVLCEVVADGSGNFTCLIDPKLEDGKEISVTSKDPAGNVSPPTTVIVDGVAPVAPVVDPTDGGSVTGTTEPGTTITVTDPLTGDVLCEVIADGSGAFACVIDPKLEDGKEIAVTSKDPAGNVSPPTTVIVDGVAPVAPVVDPSDGSSVTGTTEPGTTITVTDPLTGDVLCEVVADASGAFACVIDPKLEDGKEIAVTSKDPAGNVSPPTSVIVDGSVPVAPEVNPTDGSSVTGTTEPGTTITVTDPDTGDVLCEVVADASGAFTCVIDPKLEDGKEIAVTSKDPAGNVSPPTSVIVDGSVPLAPEVNPTDGSSVTGTTEPGTTITVTDPDTGDVLCEVVADASGAFTCNIDPKLEDGEEISVTSKDPAGNVSPPTSVIVDGSAPVAPVVDPSDGGSVTGTTEPGTTITVTDPITGDVLCEVVADASGAFTCDIDPKLEDGKEIAVTSKDPAGNVSPPTSVIVDGSVPVAPVVDPSDGGSVTGTTEPGTTITVTDPITGDVICEVVADASGAFTCDIDPKLEDGKEIAVTSKDPAGNVSPPTSVIVDGSAPVAPVVDPSDGGSVTGTTEPGTTITVTDPITGDVICEVVADASGAFTCDIDPRLEDGKEIAVTSKDPAGNVSPPISVVVDGSAPVAPEVNPTDGSSVSGTTEPGTTITVTDPLTGDVLCEVVADASGAFTCDIDPRLEDGKEIAVTSKDPAGNVSPPTSVIVDGSAPVAPEVNLTDGSSVTGTTEPGTTITVTDPLTGDVLCEVVADASGAFTCDIDPKLEDGKEIAVTSKDPAGNVSPPTTVVVDGSAPVVPEVNPTDGSSVGGTAEPGSKVTVKDSATGDVLCTAVADASGVFACTIEPKLEDGTEIEITATDATGNASPPATVIVDGIAPVAPEVHPSNGSSVAGKAESNSKVTVTDPDTGDVVCETVADASGNFSCTFDPRLEDGKGFEVSSKDPAGNVSPPTTVVIDGAIPSSPQVNPTGGSSVTGTAEPGAIIKVKDLATGDVLCEVEADVSGAFDCVMDPKLADGTEIEVTATDSTGDTSPPTTVIVDGVAPVAPVVDPTDGGSVTGTTEPGTTITVTDPLTGDVLCEVVADGSGAFTCDIDPKLEDGKEIAVTSKDPAGNVSPPTSVIVDGLVPVAPEVNPTDGSSVTGTTEPGTTITVTDPATGDVICEVEADASGAFTCDIDPKLEDGKEIAVTSKDPAGNVSPPTSVIVDGSVPVAPEVNPTDGSSVTGTTEPGTTITVTDPLTGDVLCEVEADASGAFTCDIDPKLEDGKEIAVTSKDPAGNVSPPTSVIVDGSVPVAPVVDPSDGGSVTGTTEPGTTITVTDPATGDVICEVVADASGAFTCNIDPKLEDGEEISVTSKDPAGNVSPPTTVIVDGVAPVAPVVDPTDGGSVTGTTEPGTTITVTDPLTGDVLCEVEADGSGAFTCDIDPKVEDGKEIAVTSKDPAGNVSPPTSVIVDGLVPVAPEVNPTDGSSVTGTTEPGTTITVTDPLTGDVLCEVEADASGAFTCDIDPKLEDGKEIAVTSKDPAGNVSPPTSVIVDGSVPVAPVVDPSDGGSVTGTTEPGTTITVTDPATGDVICEVVADASGAFTCDIDPKLEDGKEIAVTSKDPAGNVSPPTTVIVDGVAPVAPEVNPTDGSSVTGTAEPGSTVSVIDGNGAVLCTATADLTTGAFECVPNPVPGAGIELSVTATDPAGNKSPGTTVTVVDGAPKPPTVDPTDGKTVVGCAVPGSTVTVYDANDVVIGTAIAGADCSFVVTLDPTQPEGSLVKVEVTSPDGDVLGSLTVRVGQIRMTLDSDILRVGEAQVATGYNFKPGEAVSGLLESNPVDLGEQIADENGTVVFRFVVPQGTSTGTHKVTLTGETSGAVFKQFEVNETPTSIIPGLPVTGTTAGLIGLAGLLALTAGVGFLIFSRRRSNEEELTSTLEIV